MSTPVPPVHLLGLLKIIHHIVITLSADIGPLKLLEDLEDFGYLQLFPDLAKDTGTLR
jgi:hypothetical protein